jgi:hypothetical protein
MKTQHHVDTQSGSQEPMNTKRSGTSRLATLGAILVVILIVGASAIVYTQLAMHQKGEVSASIPSGNWANVLHGYTLTSLTAPSSEPAVLYACAMNSRISSIPAKGTSSSASSTAFTVLSSRDYGTHWQNIGANIGLTANCQLAVNPNNSSELYVLGATQSQNGQSVSVLKHTTDGGKSWTTISPRLKSASGQSSPLPTIQAGNMQQISMVAGQLFGIEIVPFKILPPVKSGGVPPYLNQLPRLVTSSDGGQTWTIIDQQLASTQQGISSYAVDPTNANTIYALFHHPWFPLLQTPTRPGIPVPANELHAALYKTTDGGATWNLLLQNLAFGTSIQLASNNSQTIYVGGSSSPLPYATSNSGTSIAQGIGSFSLQISTDAGTSWQNVPNLPQSPFVRNWFVSQNGQVYVYIGGLAMQPVTTAVVGTAIAATAVSIPQSTPQSMNATPHSMPMIEQPHLTPPATSPALQAEIQRYDPASSQWSTVTKPPINGGALLAVTPESATSDLLWYIGISQGQDVLYRYVV